MNNGKPVFKCYYRKNLKMSSAKLAAQVGHVTSMLSFTITIPYKIIVLEASDAKFEKLKERSDYVQVDLGFTEVEAGTETVLGWVEYVE